MSIDIVWRRTYNSATFVVEGGMGMSNVPTKSGKVRTTITLPRDLLDRLGVIMQISKRNLSAEIEYALEHYVTEVERQHGIIRPK